MSRLMLTIPANLLELARQRAGKANAYEMMELAAAALKVNQHRHAEPLDDQTQVDALAFLLVQGRAMNVLASGDAYGSWRCFGSANSNREGGKCGPRKKGAPRRRRPILQVVS